jgi:hypothetical protein
VSSRQRRRPQPWAKAGAARYYNGDFRTCGDRGTGPQALNKCTAPKSVPIPLVEARGSPAGSTGKIGNRNFFSEANVVTGAGSRRNKPWRWTLRSAFFSVLHS